MRIGTVSLGRIGAIVKVGMGDCLIAAQSEGICPDGSDYLGTLDSGGAAPDTSTIPNYAQEAVNYGLSTPTPVTPAPYTSLPLNLPTLFPPKGTVASPTGLQTAVTCPAGYVAIGGVCSPITQAPSPSTIISGIPNWAIYGGAGLLVLIMMSAGGGRGRR